MDIAFPWPQHLVGNLREARRGVVAQVSADRSLASAVEIGDRRAAAAAGHGRAASIEAVPRVRVKPVLFAPGNIAPQPEARGMLEKALADPDLLLGQGAEPVRHLTAAIADVDGPPGKRRNLQADEPVGDVA